MAKRKFFFKALLVILAAIAAFAYLGFVCDNPDLDSDWLPTPDLQATADLPAFHLLSHVRPFVDYGSGILPLESTLSYLEQHEKSPPRVLLAR